MVAVLFDTYKFVRKLQASGFDEQQAEALTEAIWASHESLDVATKADLERLAKATKADLEKLEKTNKHDLAEMKCELLKWVLVGLTLAQISLSVGILIKFT